MLFFRSWGVPGAPLKLQPLVHLEALAESAGADPHESKPVAMLRVDVRLQLEDEAGELARHGVHGLRIVGYRAGLEIRARFGALSRCLTCDR